VFTLGEGFLLGCVAAMYAKEVVLMALGICAILFVALIVFAWQKKIEFTVVGGVLLVALLCLLIIGIVAVCDRSEILFIACASLVAFILSCYIIYDTWCMMKSGHSYALDPEEYIFASLNLYLDVVILFPQMLQNSKNSKH
jgi:FtsH-binding integral membrane protein